MDKFLNLLFSGAVSGGIYAVMAAGVVLTYQTSGIFNFAHGAVAFVTAYFFFQLNTGLGVPVVPAALISVLIFAPLLGLALDRILLRRLAAAPVYARIVGSIGLLIALPALALVAGRGVGQHGPRLRAPGHHRLRERDRPRHRAVPARDVAPRLDRARRGVAQLRPGRGFVAAAHRRDRAVAGPPPHAPRAGDARGGEPRAISPACGASTRRARRRQPGSSR